MRKAKPAAGDTRTEGGDTRTEADGVEGWAILELMGHRRLAGAVREVTIAGAAFVRIDVPGGEREKPATQFYSPSAIYCITPTTEEVARQIAGRERPTPVHRFELTHEPEREPDDDCPETESG